MKKISHFLTLPSCSNVLLQNTEQRISQLPTQFASMPAYFKWRPRVRILQNILIPHIAKINSEIEYGDVIDYINSKNGIFPNLEGIQVILDNFDIPKIIEKSRIYGFDVASNLWNPNEALFVPWIGTQRTQIDFGLKGFGENCAKGKSTGSYILYFTKI